MSQLCSGLSPSCCHCLKCGTGLVIGGPADAAAQSLDVAKAAFRSSSNKPTLGRPRADLACFGGLPEGSAGGACLQDAPQESGTCGWELARKPM